MKLFFLAALVPLVFSTARAETFEGHLMPAKCRNDNPVEHTRACALACKSTGFGLALANGEWIAFDAKGNRMAIEALEATKLSSDLKARVEGRRDSGVIAVDSITLIETDSKTDPAPSIDTSLQTNAPSQPTVAILLFDGVQTIDYTGPYEVLSDAQWKGDRAFRIFTVAEKEGTIRTVAGMTVKPDFTVANAPHADIVVIPGGSVAPILEHDAVLTWVRKATRDARIVMSVCNGSFFLGKIGALDGLEATTTAGNLIALQKLAPKARVTANKRVIDNGKIITTGGLTAGIDGALHIVQRETSEPLARGLSLYLEYNWQREGSFLPAALAFRHVTPMIISTLLPLGADIVSSSGDDRQWNVEARVSAQSPKQLASMFHEAGTTLLGWRDVRSSEGNGCFAFDDYDGSKWQTCFELGAPSKDGIPVKLKTERQAASVASK